MTDIPPVLYKYRDYSSRFHKKLFFDRELFFASADQFNDPFDCSLPLLFNETELTEDNIFKMSFELARETHPESSDEELHSIAFEMQRKGLIHDRSHRAKVDADFIKQFNEEWGIVSLTANKDNFLMWSHYANSHTGFCVGFNIEELFSKSSMILRPVTYKEHFPTHSIFDKKQDMFNNIFFVKSKIWKYEDEFRIIASSMARKSITLAPNVFSEFIFGNSMKQQDKFLMIDYIKKNYPSSKVFDTKKHDSKFELVTERIY